MVTFVYLAHSQERFRKQAAFSILSLLGQLQGSDLEFRIAVYTDDASFFEKLPVETVHVTAEEISEWSKPIDYIHRAKLCLIQAAADRFEGAVITLDSDNCFRKDPTEFLKQWNSDTVIMEKLEYILDKPADLVGKKYKRFLKRKKVFKGVSRDYTVTMSQECWNSGVFGIQDPQRPYLKDSLSVCEDLHTSFRKHISEQLASSIVMSAHFKIVDFKEYTYHWFGHGHAINLIVNRVLENYYTDSLETLIEKVVFVKDEVLGAPLNRDKQPWYKRLFTS